MSEKTYYWQGGRKIEIERGSSTATIHAQSPTEVEKAAAESGVTVKSQREVGAGMYQLELPDERDESMARLRDNHVVHHVYHTAGEPADELHITETFFLKFVQGTTHQQVNDFIKANALEVVDVYTDISYLVKVSARTGMNAIKSSNNAAENPIVEYAEPNIVRQLQRYAFTPSDPIFPNQWHLSALENDVELEAGVDIRAPDAWDLTLGSREIVIAVADDGHDVTHPDFDGTNKIVDPLNVTAQSNSADLDFDTNVLPRAGDYHGTPCSGVAIAEHNGDGTVGVAPGCAWMPVRFRLSVTDAQLARMFDRISQSADIVSCSWGFGPSDSPMSQTLRNKITELVATGGKRGKGLIICVAAGNNNCPVRDHDNNSIYRYRDRFGAIRSYSGPIDRWLAAHEDVITVSAITSENKRSAYSSWGSEINVCAPSNNFHDLDAFDVPGRGIWTTDNEGFGPRSDFTLGSRYTGQFGGTSSATPTVAGVCGLILSRNNSLTATQVREIIQNTASQQVKIESDTAVNRAGEFIDGFSLWYGHGRVDAGAAVAEAASLSNDIQTIHLTAEDLPLSIPDNSSVVSSEIQSNNSGTITDLRVGLKITHSYMADLRVDLVAPNGTSLNLLNHEHGSTANLDEVYSVDTKPALRHFINQSAEGIWQLRVSDTWSADQGTIDSWDITLRVTQAQPIALARRTNTKKKRGRKEENTPT